MDTDSLLLCIETYYVDEDMEAHKDLYDTSNYPKEHPLNSTANKKILGKIKDECAGTPIAEAVCLRSKMYSIMKADEKTSKRQKGETKCVIKKGIMHEHFKETFFSAKQMWHGMNILRSEGYEIFGMHINKISMSAFDSKWWIADNRIQTYAYGYNPPMQFTDEEIEELNELFVGSVVFTPQHSLGYLARVKTAQIAKTSRVEKNVRFFRKGKSFTHNSPIFVVNVGNNSFFVCFLQF